MNLFTNLINWLWQHAPGLVVLILIVAACIWLAFKINEFVSTLNNFNHRLTATEKLCNDLKEGQKQLNDRQVEMSNEMNVIRREMDQRFSKIELSLNTIITYLSTKSGKFNFGENKNS